MERIVNRTDLLSESSKSASSSPAPEAIERLKELGPFDLNLAAHPGGVHTGEPDAEDEELEFRLFSVPEPTKTETQANVVHKIRLRSPSIDHTNAGFVQPTRQLDYYFTKSPSDHVKENFDSAALAGEEVIAQSQSARPGSAYPWKVLHLPISSLDKSIRSQVLAAFQKLVDDGGSKKRRRPGKKYRIKIRQKHAALRSKQEAAKEAAEAKDAAEREKKTRRNREKKKKKRLRDKAKQEGTTGKDVASDSSNDEAPS